MPIASEDAQIVCAKGGSALSRFKTNQLLGKICHQTPLKLDGLEVSHCYFLLDSKTGELNLHLDEILGIVDAKPILASELFSAHTILVVPRLGTTSSWCTKATNIVHRCGFDSVERIERGALWRIQSQRALSRAEKSILASFLYDRMTESWLERQSQVEFLFDHTSGKQTAPIDLMDSGINALHEANLKMGLALSESELEYLNDWYKAERRNPTETELMTFSQVNSEHCRHKIFNATWDFDDTEYTRSMFSMIRETHQQNPEETLVAYEDNSAVIAGQESNLFAPVGPTGQYQYTHQEPAHIIFKAETHNHPTAISPFPGAATGAGGEIRDEGATGTGGKPKAGVCGFSVSHLRIPEYSQPWENAENRPERIASPLAIMLEGPVGAASFNNEFGRPNIAGYFRTFEIQANESDVAYGFHKPIMFAGGVGNIRPQQVGKRPLQDGDALIVLGGPSMLIGLGGGAASSLEQGRSDQELDFASVQRSNPEMQRRCQETIDRCRELGTMNPILSIHDVGAGGLSNAIPEIVYDAGHGANIRLNDIPVDEIGMSPMEIWCNEAQERYILAIRKSDVDRFAEICARENCPWQMVGEVTGATNLSVQSETEDLPVVELDLDFLLGAIPQPIKKDKWVPALKPQSFPYRWEFADCVERILRFPSVADKSFLITIGDRTVSGLIHRDQMVGPWQVPVADAAVTVSGYQSNCGEAMAIGERSPIAVLDAVASARMAVGEALTNLRSTGVASLSQVRLCANWMACASVAGEARNLYDSVRSVALDLCMNLGISIPVGKDSLSMSTEWVDKDGKNQRVYSPLSLVATAFCAVNDVRSTLTPQLCKDTNTQLVLVDLGCGQNRMGMSVLHQSHNFIGGKVPDVDDAVQLKNFFEALGELIKNEKILAYHDRSDGGLFATLCEMSFAGRTGLKIDITTNTDPISFFFNEELGAVIQIDSKEVDAVLAVFARFGLGSSVELIGTVTGRDEVQLSVAGRSVFASSRTQLHRLWSELTYKMQSLRDNPVTAQQEYDRILDVDDPGLAFYQCWDDQRSQQSPSPTTKDPSFVNTGRRPTVAILREQGVNGHVEMAAAFDRAGFDAVDVVMVDLASKEKSLDAFSGIVLCGGFSFGDVFGAGRGWASLILQQIRLRDLFETYFTDTSKFVLGVCNGCQVLAQLKDIIPGAARWPQFVRNYSEQFEARLVMTEVSVGRSILTQGMQGTVLPVVVAHGEGRAEFQHDADYIGLTEHDEICLQYVNHHRQKTQQYPFNPNGSHEAVAGVTNSDGRITAIMPHPERVFRMIQYSWSNSRCEENSPWLELFRNARQWVS